MPIKDMLGRGGVVSREEALNILNGHFAPPVPSPEVLPLSRALGRVLADDVVSPGDLPPFDRSTMDGYAVRSADTFGASESLPALLTVTGDIPMGVMPGRAVGRGEAMRIATGGALPPGADAVVMLEQTQPVDHRQIEVVKAVAPQENLSLRGEDISVGECVLARGRVLRPQDLAALAGMGITHPPVFAKPRAAIISTGNELVPADTEPGPGQIRDTNSFTLEALVALAGGAPRKLGIVPDDADRLRRAFLDALADCDLILVTGGSSVGAGDLTAAVVGGLGPPGVLVHGVSIKPGKPLIVGLIPNAPKGRLVPVFGLPGHQAAVVVCFEHFVKPILARMTGERPDPALAGIPRERIVTARLARSISSAPGREDHVRVTLERREDGLWARPVFGASGLISTLVKAAGAVVVPVNVIGIEAGELVEVRLY